MSDAIGLMHRPVSCDTGLDCSHFTRSVNQQVSCTIGQRDFLLYSDDHYTKRCTFLFVNIMQDLAAVMVHCQRAAVLRPVTWSLHDDANRTAHGDGRHHLPRGSAVCAAGHPVRGRHPQAQLRLVVLALLRGRLVVARLSSASDNFCAAAATRRRASSLNIFHALGLELVRCQ